MLISPYLVFFFVCLLCLVLGTMLFRVILAPDDIRRLHLEILPARVEELMIILQQELGLEGLLVVQFEDPAFGNELCNLTNMSDLPEERATLKVFQKQTSEPSFDSQISDTSLDIASLPSALSGSSTPVRDRPWPDPFIVPKFSSDVELRLKHGNNAYHKDGSLLSDVSKDVPKELKSDILDKLAEDMYAFKTHPTSAECGLVAKSLIDKYPCLMERGSSCGWYGWKYRLVFKMGNFRQKLRIAGSLELSVNSKQPASVKKRKRQKARKSEVNFLPDFPHGKSSTTLEEERCALESEMKKRTIDGKKVDALMESTFSLRRKEVIGDEPPVKELKSRWSALFSERQVNIISTF